MWKKYMEQSTKSKVYTCTPGSSRGLGLSKNPQSGMQIGAPGASMIMCLVRLFPNPSSYQAVDCFDDGLRFYSFEQSFLVALLSYIILLSTEL